MIIKTAVFMAILDANQACTFWGYQESEPKSVKKLRKF
nr:cyclic lactone autoinducer peptide [Sellimonas sp.]